MKSIVYRTLLILALAVGACFAAPEPAIVQGPRDWTVEISFEHPQQIMWQGAGDRKPRRFWYVIVTLTNRTNDDVDLYPKCELMTEGFQVIPAGLNVSAGVFERIKRRHQSRYPFLESLEAAGNRILQGEDNTQDIAIIWPDFDAQAKRIKIFVSGLSNETVVIEHPTAKEAGGEPVRVYLRKTLELSYTLRGDPAFRSDSKLIYEGRRWVMR
ncbi:MAG: hypothetical protein ACYS76_09450 [Planctomycetota bacterium]|jgi:hypothetical protein